MYQTNKLIEMALNNNLDPITLPNGHDLIIQHKIRLGSTSRRQFYKVYQGESQRRMIQIYYESDFQLGIELWIRNGTLFARTYFVEGFDGDLDTILDKIIIKTFKVDDNTNYPQFKFNNKYYFGCIGNTFNNNAVFREINLDALYDETLYSNEFTIEEEEFNAAYNQFILQQNHLELFE